MNTEKQTQRRHKGCEISILPGGVSALVYAGVNTDRTLYAIRFLADGIVRSGQNGVFVTFEKSPGELRRVAAGLRWNIRKWEKQGRWAFVDGTAAAGEPPAVSGNYDLGALLARLLHAVRKVKAKRLSFDSLDGIFSQFSDSIAVRAELFKIAAAMRETQIAVVMTANRFAEGCEIARYGAGDLFDGNIVKLAGGPKPQNQRRTAELLAGALSRAKGAGGLLPAN